MIPAFAFISSLHYEDIGSIGAERKQLAFLPSFLSLRLCEKLDKEAMVQSNL